VRRVGTLNLSLQRSMPIPQATSTIGFLAHWARVAPARIAVVDDSESISYKRFHDHVRAYRRALSALGVSRGHLVLVSHDRLLVHWPLLIACETLGAVSCSYPVNASIAESAVLARADFVLSLDDPPPGARRALFQRLDESWLSVVHDKRQRDHPSVPVVSLGAREVVRVTHSSGTTGWQKAMALTAGAQEHKLRALAASGALSGQDRVLLTMSFGVNSSYVLATLCLRTGQPVIRAPLCNALREHGATCCETLPIQLRAWLRTLPSDFAKPPRFAVTVIGAPLSSSLREQSLRALCTTIRGRYAANEVWPIATQVDADGVGTLCDGVECRVLDEIGEPLPTGAVGQIAVRSQSMVDGYLDDPEATREFFRDGWFHTGDLGRLVNSNRLQVIGRLDDVLNRGGLKEAPDLVEAQLREIPGVVDAGVFAARLGERAEELCVALVLGRGVGLDVVRDRVLLATQGWPEVRMQAVPALPLTPMGKLSRRALRPLFGAQPAPGREVRVTRDAVR
jgi:acyl-coenzyme A synthetase/AMP-(fatty) acid ligase